MKEKRKISVFLDTNIFQGFISFKKESKVRLFDVDVPQHYYRITDFIDFNHLYDKIEICIPKVVVMECKQHMIKCFNESVEDLKGYIEIYNKIFGSLIDIKAEVKLNKDTYAKYVDMCFDNFFSNPRNNCKIVDYEEEEKLLSILLTKALEGVKPFTKEKINGKYYSDAGFKDAIVAETIYSHCLKSDTIGVLISQDRDFADAFEMKLKSDSEFVQFYDVETFVKALEEYFETNPKQWIKEELERNKYWHQRLLSEAGLKLDDSVSEIKVEDISLVYDNIYNVKMLFVVNETNYHFDFKFDKVGKEPLDVEYNIDND